MKYLIVAGLIGGISQSVSQNMGPGLDAILISNTINGVALAIAYLAGLGDRCPECDRRHIRECKRGCTA